MNREEQIDKRASDFAFEPHDLDEDWYDSRMGCFVAGAEWADKHPKKGLVDIDKVCEWISLLADGFAIRDFITGLSYEKEELISDFRKAMDKL